MNASLLAGWERLRFGGLLLDAQRLQAIVAQLQPLPLAPHYEQELRRAVAARLAGDGDAASLVTLVFEKVCGFGPGSGAWLRGANVVSEWSRRALTGESVKPRQLWRGEHGAVLPVFFDDEKHIGVGRGRRWASLVVQWLRAGSERLALLTPTACDGGSLIFAGLDFDAWCEVGRRPLVRGGRIVGASHRPAHTLVATGLDAARARAASAVARGRAGQPQGPGRALRSFGRTGARCRGDARPSARGGAARALLRRGPSRHLPRRRARGDATGGGAIRRVARTATARQRAVPRRLRRRRADRGAREGRGARGQPAGPLVERLAAPAGALFRLVHQGSHHPALPVPAYGGELFAPADAAATDGLSKALRVFETAAFDTTRGIFPDRDVYRVLERVSRARVKLRQGRGSTWVTTPVDFSDLSSEYIGILYEGLLDFELKTATRGDPVVFLAVGDQPALPLSRLEDMDDRSLDTLLEKMKDTGSATEGERQAEVPEEGTEGGDGDEEAETPGGETVEPEGPETDVEVAAEDDDVTTAVDTTDHRHVTRTRAEDWARRAVEVGHLTPRPRGIPTPEKRRAYDEAVSRKAGQLVVRVVLPGEWYLVRWGGTRKGSGTFYTRPGLAVPTMQRTLRPLAYVPPAKGDGAPDADALARDWVPKRPEEILALKVCDPACGSGTFPVAALRYLTEALYASVHHHGRVVDRHDRSVVNLLSPRTADGGDVETLGQELVPCRPDDPSFEARLKAVLKRYVVERCIYGVDLDPLAVELCRLALWIETMDRMLPFSFLDHKVKCGNSLVGAWFDQFLHYPVMAWKNREGGDRVRASRGPLPEGRTKQGVQGLHGRQGHACPAAPPRGPHALLGRSSGTGDGGARRRLGRALTPARPPCARQRRAGAPVSRGARRLTGAPVAQGST